MKKKLPACAASLSLVLAGALLFPSSALAVGTDSVWGEDTPFVQLKIHTSFGFETGTCTGTKIGSHHVLTAAHCIPVSDLGASNVPIKIYETNNAKDANSSTDEYNPYKESGDVKNVDLYPYADIALLTTNRKMSGAIMPVHVASSTDNSGVACGQRKVFNHESVDGEINGMYCANMNVSGVNARNLMFTDGGKILHGDSGGPLVVDSQVVGVISSTTSKTDGFAAITPDVLNWLKALDAKFSSKSSKKVTWKFKGVSSSAQKHWVDVHKIDNNTIDQMLNIWQSNPNKQDIWLTRMGDTNRSALAAYWASKHQAGVLSTNSAKSLEPQLREVLSNARQIHIVGDTKAITPSIESEIASLGVVYDRTTASNDVELSNIINAKPDNPPKYNAYNMVVLANANAPADVISALNNVLYFGGILKLVDDDTHFSDLSEQFASITTIGGSLDEAFIMSAGNPVISLYGQNRFATSHSVLKEINDLTSLYVFDGHDAKAASIMFAAAGIDNTAFYTADIIHDQVVVPRDIPSITFISKTNPNRFTVRG